MLKFIKIKRIKNNKIRKEYRHMKNKITVELCDKEYSLLSDETEEYVQSLAEEINKMIDEIAYKNLRISKSDAAVLTCMNLCDKNRKLADNNDNMRQQITMYIEDIAELTKKLSAYERQKPVKISKTSDIISIADDSKD